MLSWQNWLAVPWNTKEELAAYVLGSTIRKAVKFLDLPQTLNHLSFNKKQGKATERWSTDEITGVFLQPIFVL